MKKTIFLKKQFSTVLTSINKNVNCEYVDTYGFLNQNSINNLFSIYYKPYNDLKFNDYILFLKQISLLNNQTRENSEIFYHKYTFFTDKLNNYLNNESEKDSFYLGSLLKSLKELNLPLKYDNFCSILDLIISERLFFNKNEIVYFLEYQSKFHFNNDIDEIRENSLRTLEKPIMYFLINNQFNLDEILLVLKYFSMKNTQKNNLYELLEENFYFLIKDVNFPLIYFVNYVNLSIKNGFNPIITIKKFMNSLDFNQSFNGKCEFLTNIIHIKEINKSNFNQIIENYIENEVLQLYEINLLMKNLQEIIKINENLKEKILNKVFLVNEFESLNDFHKFLQLLLKNYENIESIFEKINKIFKNKNYFMKEDDKIKNVKSFFDIILLLELNGILYYFSNIILFLPNFISENIFILNFEEMCFFYVILLKNKIFFENDIEDFQIKSDVLKEYIKIHYFSIARGKLPIESWFYEILKVANVEEFYQNNIN